ncbi:MAG: hypothetical protein IJW90_05080 [Clostridia bacterium]|nr:hypothetical protein [Clostridia bacterium]
MKKNHEKLTDAIGMLNQETIHGCITATSASGRTTNRKRAVILMAACMATLLMLGAVIAIPLMRAEDPILPSVSHEELTGASAPESDSLPLADVGLSYHAAPLVNVQILSASKESTQKPSTEPETSDADSLPETGNTNPSTEDPAVLPEDSISIVVGDELVAHDVYVLFHVEDGETVTVTSQNGKIGQGKHSMALNGNKADAWKEYFAKYAMYHGFIYSVTTGQSLTLDPEFPVATWGGNRFYPENPLGGRADEDYVDFIIRDENGLITGAGSVYIGNQKPVTNTQSRYYDDVSVTRGVVLGAVRFDDPEQVTEEKAATFVASLHDKAEDVKPRLFDHLSATERYVMALGAVINQNYAAYDNFAMTFGFSPDDSYRAVTILSHKDPELSERSYLLLEDESWVEYSKTVAYCDLCGEMEDSCYHSQRTRYILTDGRILEDCRGVLTEVTEEVSVSPAEVLEDMIPEGSPMKDAILSAYETLILSEKDAGHLPAGVIHNRMGMEQRIWARYAILEICEKGQTVDVPATRYFITEEGECFEILGNLYPCAHCGEILESEETVQTHAGYSDYGVGYLLADGRVVTVENGWSGYTGEEQAFLPEFKYPESE